MTGAAVVEDREPGAVLLEDEPFDVVRANSSLDEGYELEKSPTPQQLRIKQRHATAKAKYEISDVPTLSKSSEGSTVDVNAATSKDTESVARSVTGGREARTRPMSPPSRAGLDDPETYRKNKQSQSQQQEEEEDYSQSDGTRTNTTLGRGESYRSEMPMDERQEYEEEMKALALCADVGDGSQGMPEFCETAMTAVNEICGDDICGNIPSGSSPTRKPLGYSKKNSNRPALKLGEKHDAIAKGVEEQTAIEVEYVEPLYRGKYGGDNYSSPRRKNALLKAMTRKARDDWKGKGKKSKQQQIEAEGQQTEADDNVYATFTNAEKRKFLQLINGGKTPFEATSRVLKERLESPAAGDADADAHAAADANNTSLQSEDTKAASSKKSKKKLPFWKRGKAAKEESAPGSTPSTPSRVMGGGDEGNEIYEDGDEDDDDSCENVADEIKQFLRDEADSVAAESTGAIPPPVREVEKDEEENRFRKSGISYYDGVRKNQSEEDEAYYYNDGQYPEDGVRTRKIKMPKGIKGGISKMMERNKATPVPGEEPSTPKGRQTLYDEEKKADSTDDAMAAQLTNVNHQMPDVDDEVPTKSPEEIVDDLNMDAYLGATESMAARSFDATSVVSGKSFKTSGTNLTSVSTRSRRPGQAKVRLEMEKGILNTSTTSSHTRGWQESIEEVAARTGKIWDPVTGWRDYIDPRELAESKSNDNNETEGFYGGSIEATASSRSRDTSASEGPTHVGQLMSWKETRRPPPPVTTSRSTASESRKSKSPSRSRRSNKKAPVTSPKDTSSPRGWAATMKAATAKLNLQGKKWDPEKGWTGLSEEDSEALRPTPSKDDVAVTAESDTQDFGTLSKLDEIASNPDKSMQFLSEEEEAEGGEAATDDGEASSSAKTSRESGKYIQIADSGSVREYSRSNRSRPVNVTKQNLDQDDADYFPTGSNHRKGPVDLDEVDDELNATGSFDENRTDFSWDADEDTDAMNNTDSRKAVPRLKIKIRDPSSTKSASQSEASFDSSASIPRLAAPKRDTSPIRGRGSGTPTSERPPLSRSPSQGGPVQDEAPDLVEEPEEVKETITHTPTATRNLKGAGRDLETINPPSSRQNPPDSPTVSDLHKMWEKRTTSWDQDTLKAATDNPEWKSFLVKKVQAESAAQAKQDEDGDDSLFEFDEDGNPQKKSPPRRRSKRGEPEDGTAFDNISELSPIRHDESDSEYGTHSEASTSVLQGTTFLQRLQACAAPVVNKGSQIVKSTSQNCAPNSDGPISAHLAFLKNNPGVGGSPDKKGGIMQASARLCGQPDVIVEDDEETSVEESTQTPIKSPASYDSTSKRRSRSKQKQDDLSSVVSDGFGAQSAYLEAIAMKAAVSGGSKKKKKRSPGSEVSASTSHSKPSPGSEVSTGNAKHSEKFQQFLDRRASKEGKESSPSPQQLPDHKPPSGRAEKYASDSMADRDHRGRVKEDYEETGAFPTLPGSKNTSPANDASRMAAEELAAARVEVMMQTLSSQKLEDNEAEI